MSILVIDTSNEDFKKEIKELLTKYNDSEIMFISETHEDAIIMLKTLEIHKKQGPLIVIGPGKDIPKMGIGASIINSESFRDTFKNNMVIKDAEFLKPPPLEFKRSDHGSFGEDMINSSMLKEDKREPDNQTHKTNYKFHK